MPNDRQEEAIQAAAEYSRSLFKEKDAIAAGKCISYEQWRELGCPDWELLEHHEGYYRDVLRKRKGTK